MTDTLKKHLEALEKFDHQRVMWLRLSGFVAIIITIVIAEWTLLSNHNIYWVMVSAGLTLSVIWWYWTMMLIRHLIKNQTEEAKLSMELIEELAKIKNKFAE